MRRALHGLLLLFVANCLLSGDQAFASPWPSVDLAVLADPAGMETIESVSQPQRAGEFVAVPQAFSGGYTRQVHCHKVSFRGMAG